MDTYGHLFPGAEADAVGRMREMFVDPPEALRATGTDNASADVPEDVQRLAQRAARETGRTDARPCDGQQKREAQKETPKPLQIADLSDDVRGDANESESAPRRTRTFNPLIKSQMLCQLS